MSPSRWFGGHSALEHGLWGRSCSTVQTPVMYDPSGANRLHRWHTVSLVALHLCAANVCRIVSTIDPCALYV